MLYKHKPKHTLKRNKETKTKDQKQISQGKQLDTVPEFLAPFKHKSGMLLDLFH